MYLLKKKPALCPQKRFSTFTSLPKYINLLRRSSKILSHLAALAENTYRLALLAKYT
jgi:hypothetical protein